MILATTATAAAATPLELAAAIMHALVALVGAHEIRVAFALLVAILLAESNRNNRQIVGKPQLQLIDELVVARRRHNDESVVVIGTRRGHRRRVEHRLLKLNRAAFETDQLGWR